MIRQSHSGARERIVAKAIAPVVAELRLVDAADYVAFVRLEQFASLADLVSSASELFFLPGALRLGHAGEVHLDWDTRPKIVLDLELHLRGATVWFALTLEAERASVELNYVTFAKSHAEPERNTDFLERALEDAMIRREEPVSF
ncbi:hypothetical protein NGM99_14595 [Mesorhizobium sp. RP14(2022)]|jgi:hypothetical protein|uniref:Uncharacterized protein n=1 Tax=Mesorhizobium liriopis TaxID=2953882 RepID=A0ABT1C875_9HYPH|nr:hypothetical protein [Mesorhizobium liriopis]MCO6051009.1 hypothetical protein [Mesorhizobium liriopis]